MRTTRAPHIEADLRGLRNVLLEEFPLRPQLPHDELLYCDLTTGPTGEIVTIEDRILDVKRRYEPNHLVHRFITIAEGQLLAAARRAEAKLGWRPTNATTEQDIHRDVRTLVRTS